LLKNQAKPVAPQRRETGIAEFRNRGAGKLYLAAVRAIQPCDQMQQGALAAAGFAGQRHPLAGSDAQIHPAQYGDVFSGGTIGLGQIADAQHDWVAVVHAKRVTVEPLDGWANIARP